MADPIQPTPVSQWRTVTSTIVLAIVMVLALWICRDKAEYGVKMFDTVAYSLVIMSASVAGKSAIQSLGAGSGTSGAWKVLTTSAKPGDP